MRTRIRRRSDSLRLSLNLSASDFRVNDFERLRPRLRKFVILLVTPHRHTCARTRRHEKARATPHRLVRAWSWLLLLPAKPCSAVQIRSSPSLFAIPICGSEQVLTRIDRVVADPVRYARDRSTRGHTGHGLVMPWSRGAPETVPLKAGVTPSHPTSRPPFSRRLKPKLFHLCEIARDLQFSLQR